MADLRNMTKDDLIKFTESLVEEREEWRKENGEMGKKFEDLQQQFEDWKKQPQSSKDSQNFNVAEMMKAFKEAVDPHAMNDPNRNLTGEMVELRRGDLVKLFPSKGGTGKVIGGWFKCSEEDEPDRLNPAVAIVNKDCAYDKGVGVPYHQLHFKMYKRFLGGEVVQVNDREPRELDEEGNAILPNEYTFV